MSGNWWADTAGACTGCGVERLTPGLAPDGGKLCTDCAGGIGDFFCEQCGQEARRYRRGVCDRCVLTERLRALLDDGTGSVRTELLPLFDALRQIRRPWGALTWTSKPHTQRNLRALALKEVPLTHDGLSQLTPWRSVAYLRDLLMQSAFCPRLTGSCCCSSGGSPRNCLPSATPGTGDSWSSSRPGTFSAV